MNFDSLESFVLLIATLAAFYGLPRRWRGAVLLAASLAFYGAWSVPFIGLIVISAGVDYLAGVEIARTAEQRRRKLWLVLSMATNLAILSFFKYAGFFIDTLHAFLPEVLPKARGLDVALPAGISFYTFQSMSYTIDVYRRRIAPARSFFDFFLFVLYFPQLIAGPIERFGHLMPQLERVDAAKVDRRDVAVALLLIGWGLVKKMVIADNLAAVVADPYANPEAHGAAALLAATYAFAFQIFCDFSAYSDIARGTALLFGVKLIRNFRLPYLARNPSDFWKRWHVSLSEWIRDYLYIPLGGNRGGPMRTVFNLFVTMALAGLWHGAAWHYVVWGIYHGLLLGLQRLLAPLLRPLLGLLPESAADALRIVLTFHLVAIGWVFFRAENVDAATTILARLLNFETWVPIDATAMAFFAAIGCAWLAMGAEGRFRVTHRIASTNFSLGVFLGLCGAAIAILTPENGVPFIYFQF